MHHGVFTAQTSYAKGKMLHNGASGLPVNQVTICEGIFEHGNNWVDVIGRLWPNVFKHERQGLETPCADIEFGRAVFIQDGGDASKC